VIEIRDIKQTKEPKYINLISSLKHKPDSWDGRRGDGIRRGSG